MKIKSTYYSLLVILFILFLTNLQVYSQIKNIGIPEMVEYTPQDYGAEAQNWSFVQDKRGVLYFANNIGILEYDGNTWRLIKIKDDITVRSLAYAEDGRIYVGGLNELGFLSPDSLGLMKYSTLTHLVPDQYKNFLDVWKIFTMNNIIIFQCYKYIFILQDNKIKVIEPQKVFYSIAKANDRVFVSDRKIGLFEIIDNNLTLYQNDSVSPFSSMLNIHPFKGDTLLFLAHNSLYKMIGKELIKWDNDVSEYLNKYTLYHSNYIDGYYIFGTRLNGTLIMDIDGNPIQHISNSKGIKDRSTYYVGVDNFKNIWLCTNSGLINILSNSSFSIIDERHGLSGSTVLQTPPIYEGKIFVGANKGVFFDEWKVNRNPLKEDFHFKQLKNIVGQSWDGIINNGELFICSNFDLIKVKGESVESIGDIGPWCIFKHNPDSNTMIGGFDDGLYRYRFENNKWVYKNKIHGFNEICQYVAQDKNGQYWVGEPSTALYLLTLNENCDSVIRVKKYNEKDGLPNNFGNYPFKIDDEIIFGTEKGVYKYNSAEQRFIPYSELNNLFDEPTAVIRIIENKNHDIWLLTKVGYFEVKLVNGRYILNSTPFKKINNIAKGFSLIVDGTLFFTDFGLVHYKERNDINYSEKFNALIRKVECTANGDSLLFGGTFVDENGIHSIIQNEDKIPVLKYSENSIQFQYSATFYDDAPKTKYSYILEGFSENWSEWSLTSKKEFTNLPEGKYIFKVKAKNIYDTESNIAEYAFVIETPWFRSIIAYLAYLIFAILFIIIIVKLYTKRLEKQKKALEEIVKERTHEIRLQNEEILQQKEEILASAEQLMISNQELEKLSIVASETDNAVVITNKEGDIEWVNAAFIRITGFDLNEFIQERGKNIFTSSTNENFKLKYQECITQKRSVVYEGEMRTKNGDIRWIQTTLTPIFDEGGSVKKLIAIDSDISKLKHAELEIIERNEILKAKNLHITDSINYAKLIQEAMLPSKKLLEQYFPDSFILFKPKDIVSGDFYWFTEKNGKLYIVSADCTGHGVPGAFMSIIGITSLNDIVNKQEDLSPAGILEKLNKVIVYSLGQDSDNEKEQSDGMDMTICCIDRNENTVTFACANHFFYVEKDSELKNIDGDFYSIGGNFIVPEEGIKFTDHTFEISKGMSVFMFSDGYTDQFGGNEKKKFMEKRFRELLNSNLDLPMEEIKNTLETSFESWKMNLTQVDDICVIGFRIH